MNHQRQTSRVVAAVVRRGNLVLVCRRPSHKRHGGLWEFPGGKLSTHETDEDALARELHEELGVKVLSASPAEFEATDPGSDYLIAFVPVTIEGEPVCTEHTELMWADAEGLRELTLAPSDARYVEWLLAESNDVA